MTGMTRLAIGVALISLVGASIARAEDDQAALLKALPAAKISLQQGIPAEKAKEIVRIVKDSKKKVQASIQGDTVRVAGKDRDDLQAIISTLRGRDLGVDLQFTNYRTN